MPDVKIKHPEKGEGTVDTPELLNQALAKGWTIAGPVPISHPEKGSGTVDTPELFSEAMRKGWSVDFGTDEPHPAASQPWSLNLESVDRAQYEQTAAAIADQRFQRELAAQRQREALQEAEGADLTTGRGLVNALQTYGEGAGRFMSLGFDAPMAAAQAAGAQAVEQTVGGDAQLTAQRGVVPRNQRDRGDDGTQRPVNYADRFDEAMGNVATRNELNPVTAFAGEATAGVASAAAAAPAAGDSVLLRLAAKAPTARIAQAATRLGVRTAAPLAAMAEAPGLTGTLARIAAPALALGVEGAAQGAPQGAGAAVNDLWQDGKEQDVAQYLVAGGNGLLTGAALGFGLGAAVGTVKGVRARGKGPVALREMGLAPEPKPELPDPTAPEQLAGQYPTPEAPGAAAAAARKVVKLTPDAAKKIRDELYPELEREFNEFLNIRQDLDEVLDLKAKRAFVEKHGGTRLGGKWTPEEVRRLSGLPTNEELDALADMSAIKYDGKGTAALLGRLKNQLSAVEQEMFKAAETRPLTEGDLFLALDQQKRYAQKVASRANDTGQSFLFDTFKPRVDELQTALTDDSFWTPQLAQMQRETNAAWSQAIAAGEDSSLRPMLGQVGVHASWNPYEMPNKVNGHWLYGHMGAIGVVPPEAQTEAALNRFLNANADDVVTRARVYGSEDVRAKATRMAELRKSMQLKLGQSAELNKNISSDPNIADNLGILGQLPGMTYAAEVAADRAREAAYKATLKTVQETDAAAQLQGLLLGAKPSNDVAAAVAAGPRAAYVAANPKEVAEYVRQLVAGDPSQDDAIARLEGAVGLGLGKAARAQLEAQRAFIAAKAGNPSDPQYERRLQEYGSAMMRPVDALKRIGSGVGTPADRETVQTLYPALWTRFVSGAIKRVDKPDVTYDDKVRASRALGIPLVPELDPQRYRALQQQAVKPVPVPVQPQSTQAPTVQPAVFNAQPPMQ